MLQKIMPIALMMFVSSLHAYDQQIAVTKETKLMQTQKSVAKKHRTTKKSAFKNYKPFTGKVLGNGVRLRLNSDVESPIISELEKDELFVVVGEKDSFYAVEAPSTMDVYVFRTFVLENKIEGNRVNVRLRPELTAPIVGHLNTGDYVNGKICEKNHKWLSFAPPKSICFFVAKEYLEKVGGPEMKEIQDQKMTNLKSLIESADLLAQSEMLKPFEELDIQKITQSYTDIVADYAEFPKHITPVKEKLAKIQEEYINRKLSYLENKAMILSKNMPSQKDGDALIMNGQTALTSRDRMKMWEKIEETLFLSWSKSHLNKSIDDFYDQQKFKCVKISGIVEAYNDPIMNKPGSYIVRDRELPRAYLYSTMVDLHKFVGQYVTLVASERPNNDFAFPAYFVMDIE